MKSIKGDICLYNYVGLRFLAFFYTSDCNQITYFIFF